MGDRKPSRNTNSPPKKLPRRAWAGNLCDGEPPYWVSKEYLFMIQHEYAIAPSVCVFPAFFFIIILAISNSVRLLLLGDFNSPQRQMRIAYLVGSWRAADNQASSLHFERSRHGIGVNCRGDRKGKSFAFASLCYDLP